MLACSSCHTWMDDGRAHTGSIRTEQGKEGRNEIWTGSWFELWKKCRKRSSAVLGEFKHASISWQLRHHLPQCRSPLACHPSCCSAPRRRWRRCLL